ncbi:AMP-binding protein [Bombilactobacillus thymidiniphilus]|uniref:AMP-binding protein n=1 Tax=Bombilactobacillus thymidiniphilus TaxID=2923363 RepID=UPI0037C07E13
MHNLQDVLLATAQTNDRGFYFIDGQNKEYCSYQEFIQRSLSVLTLLRKNDIHPGETLAIQTIKPEATLLLIWACILGDIIPAPCAIDYSKRQLSFLKLVTNTIKNVHFIFNKPYNSYLKKIADDSESSFLNKNAMTITEEDVLMAAYDQHLPLDLQSSSSDQRIMLFSSGTTGTPKGIIYSDDNLYSDLSTISKSVNVSRQDSFLNWLPLNHILGLSLHFIALFHEMDQYILPANIFLQKPSIWLELIAKYEVTISASPNFGYKLCLQNELSVDNDLSCLRLLIMGAEPTSLDLIDKFVAQFSQNGFSKEMISCGYGLTETQLVSLSEVGQPLDEVYI